MTNFYPKGGMCAGCEKSGADCSALDFSKMPIFKRNAEGSVCVICTKYQRRGGARPSVSVLNSRFSLALKTHKNSGLDKSLALRQALEFYIQVAVCEYNMKATVHFDNGDQRQIWKDNYWTVISNYHFVDKVIFEALPSQP